MKNTSVIILSAIILCSVIVFGLFMSEFNHRINGISEQLINISNSMNYSLNASMDNIRASLEESFKKQNSIIESYSLLYSPPDPQSLKYQLTIEIIPKEYTDNTTAVCQIDQEKASTQRNGSTFTGTFFLEINKDYKTISVDFNQNGLHKTETISEELDYREKLKKIISIDEINFPSNPEKKDNFIYDVKCSYNSPFKDKIKSAKLFAIENGNKKWMQDLTFSDSVASQPINFTYDIDKPLETCIEINGNSGFVYCFYLDLEPDRNANIKETTCKIYDQAGKELIF